METNETKGHLIRLIKEIFHSFFNPMDQSVGITKHIKTQNENVELTNTLQYIRSIWLTKFLIVEAVNKAESIHDSLRTIQSLLYASLLPQTFLPNEHFKRGGVVTRCCIRWFQILECFIPHPQGKHRGPRNRGWNFL